MNFGNGPVPGEPLFECCRACRSVIYEVLLANTLYRAAIFSAIPT